ncbi:MAG: hypothetical protein DI629_11875 [Mesorhizobium amorphae]|nr:MAG: hypothetical protein DI629_11875 [Mesorhizobium amorphae]
MIAVRAFRGIALAASLLCLGGVASAQEISEAHIKAARGAIASLKATDTFDAILPAAATALKSELIRKNPDLEQLIVTTVDEKTIALAARRADLEREAALAYARVFTEPQLNEMAAFFGSETGQKLLSDGQIVNREVARAAEIWQRGVARDLAQSTGEALAAAAPAAPPAPEAAPAAAE